MKRTAHHPMCAAIGLADPHLPGNVMHNLKKLARTVQVRFPALLDTKYVLRRAYQRTLRRPYDRDFALLQRCEFPDAAVFVDIGANRGEAIDAMRIFHPHRRIVAFEPNRALASRLSSTYASDPAVEIVACGLGAEHAELELTYPSYNNWDFDALASFKYDPESLSEKDIINFDKAKLQMKTLRAEVKCLDDFSLQPCFIKVDTEGFERQVIRGGLETLRKHLPLLLLENGAMRETMPELRALGYEPHRLAAGLERGFGHRNTFYIHPSRHDWLPESEPAGS
jgi:FkbM family methyltransferase